MVAEHYVRDIDMVFYYKAAQNLIAEHNERDIIWFSTIERFKNLVAEHYVRDIDMIFHYKAAQNLAAEHYVRDIDMIFHIRWLKTWFQSSMKIFLYDFPL